MRLRVAVCDDEKVEAAYLSSLLDKWGALNNHMLELECFYSGESLLFHWEDHPNADVLLLDIQMTGMNGMALAKCLRQHRSNLQLIFVTGYPDFMAEGYEVEALHYLLKPIEEETLFRVLDRAVERLEKAPRAILFPKAGGVVRLLASEILYGEAMSHSCILVTEGGRQEFSLGISDLETLLGEGFFRCHRSYVVSLGHVRHITKNQVLLEDGTVVPLSRGLYDGIHQAFIQYR